MERPGNAAAPIAGTYCAAHLVIVPGAGALPGGPMQPEVWLRAGRKVPGGPAGRRSA